MSSTDYNTPAAQPGWYADQAQPDLLRYFDGTAWTGATMPAAGAAPGYQQAPIKVSNTFSTIAIVLGALAVLFLPIVLGPIGIVMSAIGFTKKEPRAPIGLGVAIGGTVLGMILGALFFASSFA